jgi:pantetheine-phosphate adenylyltransferase
MSSTPPDTTPPGAAPRVAVYPGSFDPITLGHEDLIHRSLRMVDRVIVAVAYTATQRKSGLFPVEERVSLIKEIFRDEPRVECVSFQGLLVDFCRDRGANLVVRGLRAVSDFEYELQMAQMNQELWDEIETIFLTPDVNYSFLSASLVREVARLGGDVSSFVSPATLDHMRKALQR